MLKLCIGVGMTDDQELSYLVLEHSIKRYLSDDKLVDIIRLSTLEAPDLKLKRKEQRTPFSLQRFLLARQVVSSNYDFGLYLDSDMLLLSDVSKIVDYMNSSKYEIETVNVEQDWKRRAQTSVMVMTRTGAQQLESQLNLYINDKISYDELMYLQKIEFGRSIPAKWNSLEFLDSDTKLIHWTDVDTQPWLSKGNPNAGVWYSGLHHFLSHNRSHEKELLKQIELGNVLPSLREIADYSPSISRFQPVNAFKDLFFIPPPRIRKIKNRKLRKILGPIFYLLRFVQYVRKGGQINVR